MTVNAFISFNNKLLIDKEKTSAKSECVPNNLLTEGVQHERELLITYDGKISEMTLSLTCCHICFLILDTKYESEHNAVSTVSTLAKDWFKIHCDVPSYITTIRL